MQVYGRGFDIDSLAGAISIVQDAYGRLRNGALPCDMDVNA